MTNKSISKEEKKRIEGVCTCCGCGTILYILNSRMMKFNFIKFILIINMLM